MQVVPVRKGGYIMEMTYRIDYISGEYICGKCGKRIKVAPKNHAKLDKPHLCGYWGDGQKYNYRGGKGALMNHLRKCFKNNKDGMEL
jgi:hypothetical protein